jgi:hypothetical protein
MPRFRDKHGHTRWQGSRKKIREFIDKHDEKAGPILKAVIGTAMPRVGRIIDAIEEVRASKMTSVAKEETLSYLEQLMDDVEDDEAGTGQIPNDFPLKKYITPILVAVAVINYFHLQVLVLYGIRPVPPEMMEMATGAFWTAMGLWQAGRIINNREAIKRIG